MLLVTLDVTTELSKFSPSIYNCLRNVKFANSKLYIRFCAKLAEIYTMLWAALINKNDTSFHVYKIIKDNKIDQILSNIIS
jgi:hypothetical protein